MICGAVDGVNRARRIARRRRPADRSSRSRTSPTATARSWRSTTSRSTSRAGIMVGIVGPDGVGKSTLMALVAGSQEDAGGDDHRPRRRHRATSGTGAPSARASPTCRRGWARTSISSSASTTTSTSWRGSSGCRRAERRTRVKELLDATGLGPFADSPGRQAVGRDEAEGRPVRRAGPRSGSADPRRADHRRRSAVAAAVLGADRRHPRRAPGHERRHLHRLHGRGAAVGLDRGHGRRPRAGDRHARRADGADGDDGSGAVLHRAAARGEARAATRR